MSISSVLAACTEDRKNHMFSVGMVMRMLAEEMGWNKEDVVAMLVLGNSHDIGYSAELGGDVFTHPNVGADFLSDYQHSNEVRYHGRVGCEYKSRELDLLNFADLHVNGKGEVVTLDKRLNDIRARYGEDSAQYKDAKTLSESVCTADMEALFSAVYSRLQFMCRL